MNKLYLLLAFVVLAGACKKEKEDDQPVQHPAMTYVDLQNHEIKLDQEAAFDIDSDGRPDVVFFVYYIGAGQTIKTRFTILGSGSVSFLTKDDNDQSVSPVKNLNDVIHIGNELPYEWWGASETYLAEKIEPLNGQPAYWLGNWKNANHKFFPIQFTKLNKGCAGWIELSFDMQAEKLVLHRAAYSTVADSDIQAGK
ncbi:MAG TPA: hypothetical protein VHM26_15905 [Chitinophagaceae bacterium]|nr:hypothetical protein [Chitinophagaceae bacterium]